MKSILSGKEHVQRIDKIKDISVNPLFDSELEQRFVEAVRTKIGAANVSDTIRNGKHSYYVKLYVPRDSLWQLGSGKRQCSFGYLRRHHGVRTEKRWCHCGLRGSER